MMTEIFSGETHCLLQDRPSNEQACRRENWFGVQQMVQKYESFVMELVELAQTLALALLVLHRLFSTEIHTLKNQRREKGSRF